MCHGRAGAISFALNQIIRHRDLSYIIDRDRISRTFNDTICQHGPLGHGSEVAWALWGLLVLRIPMNDDSYRAAANMNDSIVALLLLDANSKRLIPSGADFPNLRTSMTSEELYGEHWLLSYEANVKGWLPSVHVTDHVSSDACFSVIKSNGVYFYDNTLSDHARYETPVGWVERY